MYKTCKFLWKWQKFYIILVIFSQTVSLHPCLTLTNVLYFYQIIIYTIYSLEERMLFQQNLAFWGYNGYWSICRHGNLSDPHRGDSGAVGWRKFLFLAYMHLFFNELGPFDQLSKKWYLWFCPHIAYIGWISKTFKNYPFSDYHACSDGFWGKN